jgi:hypothetical protein
MVPSLAPAQDVLVEVTVCERLVMAVTSILNDVSQPKLSVT